MVKISAIINTFNEEDNIKNCLECIKWVDEIIIVDMYSNDKTVEIASNYTDQIYMHERLGYADPARQFALDKVTNEWVIMVDADELVPIELKEKLIEIAKEDLYDAVVIPFHHYCCGKLMRGGRWDPNGYKGVRFFKKNMMRMTGEIHHFLKPNQDAKICYLKDEKFAIVHFSYLDVDHYIEKMNRYTTIEAKEIISSGGKIPFKKTLRYNLLKEVFYLFIIKKGYKDGILGFYLEIIDITSHFIIKLKKKILKKYPNGRKEIKLNYQIISDEIISKYNS